MLKIDAHQHFWKYDAVRDSWINDDMHILRNDFFPEDIISDMQLNGIDGSVLVQVDQSETEDDFLLKLAEKHNFIKGIVGWVDLQAVNVAERLHHYSRYKNIKGFRHILQGETNRALMLEPNFMRGISHLAQHNFTYDILIYPDQLKYADELVVAFPDQKFVVDHIAKPRVKNIVTDDEWVAGIKVLAKNKNVWCKVSGMVTEADWTGWKDEDFKLYLDTVFEVFGIERCMFGSDWPVCLLAAKYSRVKNIVNEYVSQFSAHEKDMLFGGNAIEFYNL